MNKQELKQLLSDLAEGRQSVDEAFNRIRSLPFKDLGIAKLDTHRKLRTGAPEVIFCKGKSNEQLKEIFLSLNEFQELSIATKVTPEAYAAISSVAPEAKYHQIAQIVTLGPEPIPDSNKKVLLLSAGTSDQPIAEEAAVTARLLGCDVKSIYDVGVAGLHRLLAHEQKLQTADIIIVVAGMEGALASVVSGLTSKTVIAVPTSIGYGASFEGIAALLGMLNSCAPGVVVVNIDNGFGAGYAAAMMLELNGA